MKRFVHLPALALSAALLGAGPVGAQDSDASGEAEILARMNAMRNAAGLPPLRRDARLDAAARTHSADMAWNGMLAHVSPRTGDPSDRVRATGLEPVALAENVAQGPDAVSAYQNLVQSDAHRANMLNDRFTHVGISVVPADGAVYLTQLFAQLGGDAEADEAPAPGPAPAPAAPASPAALAPWSSDAPGAPADAAPAPPDPAGEVRAEALPELTAPAPPDPAGEVRAEALPELTAPAPPANGERRVAGYWVHAQGRWWYYPLPPDARPGQVLEPDPNVHGPPPPGVYNQPQHQVYPYAQPRPQPGYRVYRYPPGYRHGYRYRYYSGPRPFGWSPRRHYDRWYYGR